MRKRALIALLGLCMALLAFPAVAHAEDVSLDFHICPEKAYYVVGNEADPIFVAKDNGEDGVAEWYSSPTGSTDDAIKINRTFSVMGNVVYEGPTLVGDGGWRSVAYTPPTDAAGVNWYYLRLTDATGDIHVTNRARIEVANELYDVWIGDIRITDLSADDVLGDADEGATVT